ncbi:MAG: alpha/beta hydrolase [Cyanobacteria bacterium J06621_11]
MVAREFQRIDVKAIASEHHVLRDGRTLAYARYGCQGGTPVYYFHGCPGSRLEGAPTGKAAAAAGFEVFAFDRPGCGQSSYAQGYRMLDWPIDVVEFAEAMHHKKFGIIGLSAGGAYIDACAYAIPDRLLFAYDLAGWGPVVQVQALQNHLAPLDRFFLKLASSFGTLFRQSFQLAFSVIGLMAQRFSDRRFAHALRSSMGADDEKLILGNENMTNFFRLIVAESFAQGSRGPADDAIRCYSNWGFDLHDIHFPLKLWHGTDDGFASFEFAKFKHDAIPQSSLKVFQGRGHLHLATVYDELFTHQ